MFGVSFLQGRDQNPLHQSKNPRQVGISPWRLSQSILRHHRPSFIQTSYVTCVKTSSLGSGTNALIVQVWFSSYNTKIDVTDILCPDFDLCSSCLIVQPETIGSHSSTHAFFAIEEPGGLWAHAVFSSEDAPEPLNQPANEGPTEHSTSSAPVQEQNALDVLHNATCDLCSSAILGDRFVSIIYIVPNQVSYSA
jgi:hypothetical protein